MMLLILSPVVGQSPGNSATTPASPASSRANSTAKKPTQTTKKMAHAGKKARRPKKRPSKAVRRARAARIKLAFVASAELRPMAQQLATLRTPAAYTGVTKYAHAHSGEAAAAAYLALGHASMLDKRYEEAVSDFRQARQAGEELADYADFLAARASHDAGKDEAAEALLKGFSERYPDSIFVDQAPELEANTLLNMKDAAGAQRVARADRRCTAGAALLGEECDVGDDRAGEREHDSELNGQASMKVMRALPLRLSSLSAGHRLRLT